MTFIVYTGWLGNGRECVILAADTPEKARGSASEVMLDTLTEGDDRRNPDRRKRLGQFDEWDVEELILPRICDID